jgi:type I restriction enzyme M protein
MSKKLIQILGFSPKENASDIFIKKYSDGYTIEVDFKKEAFNYGNKIKADNKTTQNFSQDENWVVLECVDRLLEKGYKPKNITLEKTWPAGHGTSGRLDICVTKDNGAEYLLIECKTFGREFDKELANMKKNGGQLFTYFKFSNKPDIIMLYASELNGKEVVYKNEIVKIEDDYRAGDVKDFYDKWNKLTKDNGVFDEWVEPYNFISKALTLSQLKPIKQEDSSFIFNRFLEILRHNIVSDKPNAFNKIFTLFLCKIYDEKTNEETDNELGFQWVEGIDDDTSFQLRLTDLYKNGMKEFLEKKVTDFSEDEFEKKYKSLDASYKKSLLLDFKKMRLEKNNEFAIKEVYDGKSFKENAKVVKEVVELLQNFRIRYTQKQQYLSDFFELLLTTGLKQESGQFFTPVPIAQFIIKSLPIDKIVEDKLQVGKRDDLLPYIMDYAAGSGHFLTESMHEIQRLLNNIETKKLKAEAKSFIDVWRRRHFDWALQYVYGIEKDYRLVKVGKVGCYLHGDGLANVIHSDGLANFNHPDYKHKLKEIDKDFNKENKQFEIVISNPPYSVSSFKNASRDYYKEGDFDLYEKLTDNSSEIECLFIERTKQLLKDGGIAGIILPSSILSNTGIYTKAREIILQYFDIVAITELGSNTFMATGTNTVTLFLRRRNNYESANLKTAVDKFFNDLQDVTLNGVEKPISKYANHVWQNVSFTDYKSLLQKVPNKTITEHEIFIEYKKKIKAKNDKEFWDIILEKENEKLYYFILAYPQQVVLVKSGEKDAEKQFLGYEFSNRRGSEGIHPIQRGKNIEDCTQLFDPNIFDNPTKASTYIYKAFKGDYDFVIDESMRKNVSRHQLIDMLTFDRVEFEKNISLSLKKKVKIESKWNFVKIEDICSVHSGGTPSKNEPAFWDNGNIPWLKSEVCKEGDVLTANDFITQKGLNSSSAKYLEANTTLIALVGATKGKTAFLKFKATTNQNIAGIFSSNENIVLNKYLFITLKNMYSLIISDLGQYDMLNLTQIRNIKIPLPPKNIQEEIVKEIETLEIKEQKTKEEVATLKNSIAKLFDALSAKEDKLENIASMLKRGKSAKYGNSEIQIIKSGQARGFKEFDFSQKHFVEEGFVLDERKLEKGDILINSSGVGTAGRVTLFDLEGTYVVDSHVTILRPNKEKVLPDFILQSLAKIGFKNIEAMAMGQSGQIELSITTIQNIKIPLPQLSEQKKIVSQIEKLEEKINQLQDTINQIPKQKEAILKKYL